MKMIANNHNNKKKMVLIIDKPLLGSVFAAGELFLTALEFH